MSQNDNYEMKIIGMVIYQHLEKKLPIVTMEELKKLESQLDNIVWEVATMIYRQSGHKFEFITIKEIIELWLQLKNEQLIKASTTNPDIKKSAHKSSTATATRSNTSPSSSTNKQKVKNEWQIKFQKISQELGSESAKEEVIKTVCKAASEHFKIDSNEVNLQSNLVSDLGADDLDLFEFVLLLEEVFDIEINDADQADKLGVVCPAPWNPFKKEEIRSHFSMNKSKYIVINFVELICQYLS